MQSLRKQEKECMIEAFRRLTFLCKDQRDLPITDRWTGLGFKTEYRSVIKKGWMRWLHGEPEDRCMGWLCLTDEGVSVILDHVFEFVEVLKPLR